MWVHETHKRVQVHVNKLKVLDDTSLTELCNISIFPQEASLRLCVRKCNEVYKIIIA